MSPTAAPHPCLKIWPRVLGSAFELPIRGGVVDVLIADPPYEGRNRGKRRVRAADVGYIPYAGREWFEEAWRVLAPSGHLYIVAAMREIPAWHDVFRAFGVEPQDTICWHAANAASMAAMAAYWRRGIGNRAPTWRPIFHLQKPPALPITWPDNYVLPNFFSTATVQSNMHEAFEWPNQLPEKLIRWLLAPHSGTATVLDLFSGTGTAASVATSIGLRAIAVDMSREALSIGGVRGSRRPPMVPLVEVSA